MVDVPEGIIGLVRADKAADPPASRVARSIADWSRTRQQGEASFGFESVAGP